jgi:hypothetical protein
MIESDVTAGYNIMSHQFVIVRQITCVEVHPSAGSRKMAIE